MEANILVCSFLLRFYFEKLNYCASFNLEGNIPVLRAWLTTNDRCSAIISLISFRIMHDILSWPELVFIGKLFNTFFISLGLVFLSGIWKCLENANNDQMGV